MNTEQPKKILIIESGEGVGGSAFSMYRIVKYLDKAEYRPYVFVYYKTSVFAEIAALGVPLVVLPLYRPFPAKMQNNESFLNRCLNFFWLYGNLSAETLFNGIRLATFIRKNKIDIVHCNNGVFENFAAVFAARLTNTPCISHIRGTEPLMKVERLIHNWLSKIIVLNRDMLNVYANAFGGDKVHLVYNGVDLDLFKKNDPRKIRTEFSISDHSYCVGTFARLVEGKGIPEFLKAAALASQNNDRLSFFIAGGGATPDSEFEKSLRFQANDLGLGDRVVFAGWRDDIPDCMAAMNLVLQISTTYPEGMSLAPIEAMALSKPVIVTDNPGYADIVEPDVTGYIVRAGDTDTLAELIHRLVNDAELTENLGRNGHKRLLEHFEYRVVVKQIENIYVQVLSK